MLFYRLILILISFSFFVLEATPTNAQEMRGTTIKSSSELDYPPFSVILKDGTASGFSVELLKATLETMGKKVEFNVDEWSKIKEALENGNIDVLPLVAITDERAEYYDFTIPYLRMHGAVFTREDYKHISRAEDINNKILVAMKDDYAHEYLKKNNIGQVIITFGSYEEAFKELSSGKYDAVVVQKLVGFELIKKLKLNNIKVSDFLLHDFEQKFCFAVKSGDKELLSLLNEGLSIIISNGTYEKIYEKWFRDTDAYSGTKDTFINLLIFIVFLFLSILIGGLVRNRILKKRVLEKTREQEKIQSYLDVAQVLIMALDNNQNVTMINKKGADILGYKKEDIIGKNFIENFIPEIIRQDISNLGDKVIKQKEINTEHENHILTKSGQERLLSWKNSKLLDDEGHTIGILTAGEDITDKR
ncbi:MAG: transporter substrate-binding domain-containing protein [Sulfurimonas sp.]|nr:transporter substrate-binding domain-containing protein [Sulfurimonas sp.]